MPLSTNKQKEAQGIASIYEAQSKGIAQLVDSFGGDKDALIKYLMLDKGVYGDLARTNADAIKGLSPKITVWNTNNGSGPTQSYTDSIRNIMQMVPPLFSTIHDQTGIKLAEPIVKGLGKFDQEKEQDKPNVYK